MTTIRFIFALSLLTILTEFSAAQTGTASATTAHGQTNFAVQITNIGWRRGDSVEITVTFPDGSHLYFNGTVLGNGTSTGVNVQDIVAGNESNYDGQNVTITADNTSNPSVPDVVVTATVQ